MTAITLTQAALHAALAEIARLGCVSGTIAYDVGVRTLRALLDPAHLAAGAAAPVVAPPRTPAPRSFHDAALAAEEAQPAHADTDGATPPATRRNAIRVWTPERDALIAAELPSCRDIDDLMARLAEMPGAPIATAKAMLTHAREIGVRRSDDTLKAIARTSGRKGGAETERRSPTIESGARTPERLALLRRMWPDPAVTVQQIHQAWNALPGPAFASSNTLYAVAKILGMPTRRLTAEFAPRVAAPEPEAEPDGEPAGEPEGEAPGEALPAPAPAVCAQPASRPPGQRPMAAVLVDAATIKQEVMEAFAAGLSVRAIAEDFGEPIWQVGAWQAEWRQGQQQKDTTDA